MYEHLHNPWREGAVEQPWLLPRPTPTDPTSPAPTLRRVACTTSLRTMQGALSIPKHHLFQAHQLMQSMCMPKSA